MSSDRRTCSMAHVPIEGDDGDLLSVTGSDGVPFFPNTGGCVYVTVQNHYQGERPNIEELGNLLEIGTESGDFEVSVPITRSQCMSLARQLLDTAMRADIWPGETL